MVNPSMESRVMPVLEGLPGEAIVVGASIDGETEFACRGDLGGSSVDDHTIFYGASLIKQFVGGPAVGLPGRPDPPGTIGDGGLWTSARDLLTWLEACNAAVFGAAHEVAESTTTVVDGSALDYAWGVRITPSRCGPMITHGGSWDRWQGKTVRIRNRRAAVVV